MPVEIISWFFVGIGSIFLLIGAIGLLRLGDIFARIHAAGLIDTMGLGFLILGMCIYSGFTLVTAKLIIIAIFMFFASPVSTHALSKAALDGNINPEVDEDQRPDKRRLGAEE